MKINQTIKKGIRFDTIEAEAERMVEGGYRLVCLMPELVNTYDQGKSSEYRLPTTVTCVFQQQVG